MQVNDEINVEVEKLINGGYALARYENLPVFIQGACPKDKLKVKITKINKNYANAEIISITEPSKYRVKPFCALHNVCGSCGLQFIDYNKLLEEKNNILKETLHNIAGVDIELPPIIPSPKLKEFRCKVQYPVSETKVSKRIISGYYKENSHELVNIKYCPIHPPVINELNEYIKLKLQELSISGYNEKKHRGLVKHIIYRISSDFKQLLIIFVINSDEIFPQLKKISEDIIKQYPLVKGICANFNPAKTNVIMGKITKPILGQDFYIEKLGNYKYRVSANSFFQVNPYCAELIFNKVKELIIQNTEKPCILDAYSGVSSFGIWLSSAASKVISVEEVESASFDAKENLKINNIDNIEIINGDSAEKFKTLIERSIKFDVSVIDPPRKGCDKEALDNLVSLTSKYIIYVSCNPSTLARDIKYLSQYNFKPVYIQGVDMFAYTPHIETIVLFQKA